MAAKGVIAKESITKIIQMLFKDAFLDGKIIRIPIQENGETVEIKVQLTAAKDLKGNSAGAVLEGQEEHAVLELTAEEKQMLEELLDSMGVKY